MKISLFIVVALTFIIATCVARDITVINRCGFQITAYQGTQASASASSNLASGASWKFSVPTGWTAGRVWAKIPGYPDYPLTLAEFGLNQWQNMDFYDISLVDGFNLPMSIDTLGGVNNGASCQNLTCPQNLLTNCPASVQVKQNGLVVACNSACSQWRRDSDCCQGAYISDQVCKGDAAETKWFKQQCHTSYTWPYDYVDDQPACVGPAYTVTFCPSGAGGAGGSVATTASTATTGSAATVTSGGSSGACSQSYTVKSGDTCAAISSSQGVTLANLYAYNPAIANPSCNNLQVGQVLCVKKATSTSSVTTAAVATTATTATSSSSGAGGVATSGCGSGLLFCAGNGQCFSSSQYACSTKAPYLCPTSAKYFCGGGCSGTAC